MEEPTAVYVCPRCFSTDDDAGPCPRCGLTRQQCEVGAPGSAVRQPPRDAAGRVLCRAPLWWVLRGAPYLRAQVNEHK